MPRFSPLKLMRESKSVIGLNMLTLWDAKQSLEELIDPLRDWIADGACDRWWRRSSGSTTAPQRTATCTSASNVGKVVLTL